jgi:hypothetical protein
MMFRAKALIPKELHAVIDCVAPGEPPPPQRP